MMDSVKTSIFTTKEYDGMPLPEMVKETPEGKSYIELTEVIISATRVIPTKNGWYHLAPKCNENKGVDVLDTQGLMNIPDNAEFFHIIYEVEHVYNPKLKTALHSDPVVVHAGVFTGVSEEEESVFSGTLYVLNGKSDVILDTEFGNFDVDYLKDHPKISKDYTIYVEYRIVNFNSLSPKEVWVGFADGAYYEEFLSDTGTIADILFLDGIENILKGHMLSFTFIKGNYAYDETGWYSATNYLYNNVELVY